MAKGIEHIKNPDKKNNGGAAFPCCGDPSTDQMVHGMNLRDWFAGMALQGLLSNSNASVVKAFGKHGIDADIAFAESAYAFADALIKQRGE